MGNALQQCGKYPQAIDAYDFAIAIESAFGPAYHQKAEALVAMERYNDALHTYEETLSFEDITPRTQCYMGECLERLGNLDQASE
jgi:tetratricopeptide (TPR) repeat protein